jgi:Tfp pilus assembly protein PilF
MLLLMSAKVAFAERQLPQAERILRHLVDVDPSNLEGYALLGQVYIAANRLPAATKEFAAIVQRDPNSSTAHTMLGLLMHAQRRVPEAIAEYDKAFDSDPHSATAANNLAWILAENDKDLDRALQLAQAAKAQLPNESTIADTLGWIYLKRGMLPLATTNLEEAVRLNPTSVMSHYHLGVAYAKDGDDAKARKSLERALTLQPDFARAEDAKKILATLAY